MNKHIVPCRGGCRLHQPYDTAGTAKDILLYLCLLQEREELLYVSYFNIYVKAPASQLTVTPKHLVNHLHRNHQTKLGITGGPLAPCSSNFQGISAKCLSITYLASSTPCSTYRRLPSSRFASEAKIPPLPLISCSLGVKILFSNTAIFSSK